MKKIICLLILLALVPAVHAGDKKKKKPEAGNSAPARAPGGGGGRGGGLSGMSGMGQSAGRAKPQRSAPRLNTQAPARGHKANPLTQDGGQSKAAARSSNPLMRKGGQAGARNQGANPLTKGKGQSGAKAGNPLARKNAGQAGLKGRNGNALANRNNAKLGRNRGPLSQNGRAFNRNGIRRGGHANYRIRSSREVFRNYRPVRHDRVWYTSRYDRVVVVGGGYYYWDAGYWYPAWGYDPAFSLYVYDGPIYSYDNLPPDQVTMNVQTALQDDGYYAGDIDGLVGPQTREALGAYQADHELEVTSAIDEPTVEALGLAQS